MKRRAVCAAKAGAVTAAATFLLSAATIVTLTYLSAGVGAVIGSTKTVTTTWGALFTDAIQRATHEVMWDLLGRCAVVAIFVGLAAGAVIFALIPTIDRHRSAETDGNEPVT